jgi:hypothetical protein
MSNNNAEDMILNSHSVSNNNAEDMILNSHSVSNNNAEDMILNSKHTLLKILQKMATFKIL